MTTSSQISTDQNLGGVPSSTNISVTTKDSKIAKAIEHCPICRGIHTKLVLCHKGETPILKCEDCHSEFCGRFFTGEELAEFYGSTYFQGEYGYKDYQALADMKRRTFINRLLRLEKLFSQEGGHQGKNLLDVGCADGLLVRTACERGWTGWGLDISSAAVASAKELASTKDDSSRLFAGTLEAVDFGQQRFDAIVMSDMIEHVHDPMVVLQHAKSILAKDGVLLIETPQAQGFMHKVMGKGWPMYRPPEHLLYFSQNGLSQVLEQSGFKARSSSPSSKAFTLPYLRDKLSVSNPLLAKLLSPACALLGKTTFWIPSGSFVVVAYHK